MTAAQGQVMELVNGVVNRQRSTATNAGKSVSTLSTVGTYTDRTQLETYLLSHGYSQADLNVHTINDLVYAARLSQDPTTI